jgi:hypothetical protein
VTVNSWGAMSITVTIPLGASSGPLVVSVAPNMNDSNPVSFTVVTPSNFTLSTSPSSMSITQGTSTMSTITVTPQGSFSGNVTLSASGLPSGVIGIFNPNPAATTSTLTLTAGSTATTGTFTVVLSGTSGTLTNTATIGLTVVADPTSTLPPGWSDGDIGLVGPAGSASYANGTFTVKASGSYIWGTADGFNFAYQPLSGDGTIVARLVSVQGGANSESTGVMVRETLTPPSTNVYSAFSSSSLIYFDDRPTTGANTFSQNTTASVSLPYWVKLVRSGNVFSGYTSPDGVNWVQVGTSQTVNMAQDVYIGLGVSGNDNSTLCTATFDNVSIQ